MNGSTYLSLSSRYQHWLVYLSLGFVFACGGRPTPSAVPDDDDFSDIGRPALQMYLVLTSNSKAMQTKSDVNGMWSAVHGQAASYATIRKRVKWVPDDYKLDIELDFADLPHPAFPTRRLTRMLRTLPKSERERAQRAALGISLRSQSTSLSAGNHIRLVGLAALFVAEKYNGVIVDLLTRRAWTTRDWRMALLSGQLDTHQTRFIRQRDGQNHVRFRSIGWLKYGVPDIVIRGVSPSGLARVRKRLTQNLTRLLSTGIKPGDRVLGLDDFGPLRPCSDALRLDGDCLVSRPE